QLGRDPLLQRRKSCLYRYKPGLQRRDLVAKAIYFLAKRHKLGQDSFHRVVFPCNIPRVHSNSNIRSPQELSTKSLTINQKGLGAMGRALTNGRAVPSQEGAATSHTQAVLTSP